ncbi:MAG: ANTAR domain-containing protein [Candidatus Limiplasma sp.]|nr:ANTAR domain-containing protein [Candidatus Limiplasma sp.]MEA5146632.1 ANTAR domain-containing protein [Candidatus Limiplasma sp.]
MADNKALLVAAQGQDKLRQLLENVQQAEIVAAHGAAEARRLAAGDMYALAMINAPLLDETGLELAIDLARRTTAAVILLVKTELATMINDAASEAGVLIVTKPVSTQLFEQTIRVGMACRNRILLYKTENEKLQKKYEELKIVDRAKCLLIEHMRITEEEAHRVLEKEAMNMRISRVRVARQVLDRFEL